MQAYTDFAALYDSFMDNVPYTYWCGQIVRTFRNYGINDGLVCELGCGTGTLTELLADAGYDMIGVDVSEEMLGEAFAKKIESGHDILYLNQDMRDFELYGTVRAIVSRCDSLNYITDIDELIRVFRLVNNYLDPKGLFIFDMKTEYMFSQILGSGTFARNNENGSYIWENAWYPQDKINEYELTLFTREGKLFRRSAEIHTQRAYSIAEIKNAAAEAGLEFISVTDADTEAEPGEDTARFLFVLRENGK